MLENKPAARNEKRHSLLVVGNRHKVIFEADYRAPVPLLGKLAEGFMLKMNGCEAELLLENLKDRWKPSVGIESGLVLHN